MKKIPETKARMVRWGRMWPILLSTKPMNMKKRLTRGKGVAERIISGRRQEKQGLFWTEKLLLNLIWDVLIILLVTTLSKRKPFFFILCAFSSVMFLWKLLWKFSLLESAWGFPLRLVLLVYAASHGFSVGHGFLFISRWSWTSLLWANGTVPPRRKISR